MMSYIQIAKDKSVALAGGGGARTLWIVAEMAEKLSSASRLDSSNRVLALLALAEGLVGERHVGDLIADLAGMLRTDTPAN
jgi:hypothetical protein